MKKRKWEDIERKWISKEALIKQQKLIQKQGENKIKSKVQENVGKSQREKEENCEIIR